MHRGVRYALVALLAAAIFAATALAATIPSG
jgi:hypothetical protein